MKKTINYIEISHSVHKEMTPEKYKNNDYSVGTGTDFESFRLNEHLLSLIKYYGIEALESSVKECKEFLNSDLTNPD